MPDAPEPKTERLGERYALYGEIASGGMATVHFGRLRGAIGFSRTVAIKRLNAQFVHEPEFVRMFVDEARLAARVRHPNVVATIDVVASENLLYLVMEYVQGESLAKLVRACVTQGGRVPRRIATAVMLGMLQGLHAAHEAKDEKGVPLGIVHRDISPQNVLVGTDGVARVIDFGIAKAAARTQPVTEAGQMKGKPAYISPEQIFDEDVTRLADIYAASVVYWELLTGERLFLGKNNVDTIDRVLKLNVPPPSSKVPSLLPTIDEIVLRGLARDPSKRFATARDMARAIEDCIAPASASDVGEWVERLAGEVLAVRERRLKEIEDRSSELPSEAPPEGRPEERRERTRKLTSASPRPDASSPTLSSAPPSSPQPLAFPDLVVPKRPTRDTRDAADLLSIPTPSMDLGPVARPAPGMDFEVDTTVEAPRFELDVGPGLDVFRAAPIPARVAGRIAILEAPIANRPSWTGRVVVAGVLLGLVGAGLYELPGLLLARCVEAAARQGMTLTVQGVTLHARSFVLHGVKVAVPALPFASASATEVEIGIDGLHPHRLTAQGFELTLAGPVREVADRVSAWRSKVGTDALELTAKSGHLAWANPFGEGTQLEGWDASLVFAAHTAGRDELKLGAPSIMVRTPRANLGPWAVQFGRDPKVSRLDVTFDPSTPTWATAWISTTADGKSTVAVAIPRSPLARLGIPPELLGSASDSATQIEAKLDVASSSVAAGTAMLALHGVRSGRGPMEVKLESKLSGASDPLLVDGALSVGDRRGKLSGTVARPGPGFRVNLTWRPPSSPCEVDSQGLPAAVTFSLDATDLGATSASPSHARCLLGLVPLP